MTTKFDELVAKLKEIFQIDKPELDFGIYKILHARAAEINDFLEHKLKTRVEELLKSHGQQDTKSTLDAAKSELIQNVGVDALETDGSVKQQYKAMPMPAVRNAVEKYEAALSAYQTAADSLKNETEVYSRLLDFFKRYYEEGDFISKRRYKDGVYAIPYSGEEVKLHWANADQYYTKSGENFTNYRFTLEGELKVEFKLISAETGKDNVKDNEAVRRFVLWNPETVADIELTEDGPGFPSKAVEEKDGTLEIYFQYLKIPKPKKGDAKKVTQESFVEEAEKAIGAAINADNALKTKYQSLLAQVSQDDKRTRLRKHLADYTAKNTSDYFIHKDLKGFLERELDYYVKTEMFRLDRIDEAATIKDIEAHLHVIQAFRSIALVLIGFMAQLEDFQKKLWLRKKFVTSCEYCITMDRIPDDLKPEVLKNQDQLDEWKKYGIDVDPKTVDMHALDARMVDTRHFDEEFKSKLLRAISDLDDQCDGLLIHSENFQALRFLAGRFNSSIDCEYADPPYNTDASAILYKNGYKSSSWISLMYDRMSQARILLSDKGLCSLAIDDAQHKELAFIGRSVFENELGTFCVRANPSGRPMQSGYSVSHEYSLVFGKTLNAKIGRMLPTKEQKARFNQHDELGDFEWRNLRREGSNSDRVARPMLYYPIYLKLPNSIRIPKMEWNEVTRNWDIKESCLKDEICVWPNDDKGNEKTWRWEWKKVVECNSQLAIRKNGIGEDYVYVKRRPHEDGVVAVSAWFDARYSATEHGTAIIKSLFKDKTIFDFPKSIYLEEDAIWVGGGATIDARILDFFGGSGTTAHAVIDLNRQDGGKRKYILIEMGDHFDTVLMPRIKKVVYSPEWKDGKPKVYEKGISHCFKYMTLESYEDALNNIELKRTADQESMLPGLTDDKYLLKYFLDVESRGSIISTDDFQKPFDYELKIAYESSGAAKPQKIDLVETFNYLIGLKVDSYVRRIDKGYCYLDGFLPSGEHTLVFWRDCDKLDAKKLNDELEKLGVDAAAKKATFDVIYVNGDHAVQNGKIKPAEGVAQLKVRQIEAEFLEKMFACEEV